MTFSKFKYFPYIYIKKKKSCFTSPTCASTPCDALCSNNRRRLFVRLQPSQFEQCLVQMLQSLKEPLEVKPGEINVRGASASSL